MEKDRLKFSKKDFNYFFIPFIVLALVFGVMMYITARSRIEEIYRMTEESTISIADSYSRTLEDNAAASETIMAMLDQRILAASNAVLLMQNYESNEEIRDLAEKFQVDQINLYDDKGVIVYSNYEEYIGWTAYEGHPVYDFMTGNRASLVDFELINQKLEDVKNMGITVSLDDFGTGFSSFARLRDLNIDIVKIDKQFIDNISVKKESNLISEDIISMVHKVGLEVVAEGVETDIQMQYLKKHDCDIIQGYLVSRPLAEDRAIEFLESKSGDGGIYEQKQREAIN